MALSFETGMQNLVYQMDAGVGRKVIQTVLIALFAIALAALYTFSNFQGLKDARAMEEAQLARNLAERGSLVTQCVRPLSMWRVAERSADGSARVAGHPDLFHPPLWPGILATVYRMTGAPRTGVPSAEAVYEGDYVPVAMNHLFVILAGLWVWLIGRKLFHGLGIGGLGSLARRGLDLGQFLLEERHPGFGGLGQLFGRPSLLAQPLLAAQQARHQGKAGKHRNQVGACMVHESSRGDWKPIV